MVPGRLLPGKTALRIKTKNRQTKVKITGINKNLIFTVQDGIIGQEVI